jgi:drug/metabolite transporter (DMT)-like permease
MLIAVVYGLVAMCAGGIANALLKPVSEGLGALPTIVFRAGTSALALLVAVIVLRPPLYFSIDSFLIAIAISVLGYFPFLFYVRALRLERVGIVAPIASSWIVVASAIGFIFLGDTLTSEKLFVLTSIIAGVVLASFDFKAWGRGHAVYSKKAIVLSIGAALLWGIVFPLFAVPSEFYGAIVFGLIIETVVCLSAVIHLRSTKNTLPSISKIQPYIVPVLGAGILTAVFTPAVSLGYLTGYTSVVAALSGSSIAVTVCVAALLYKERLTVLQYAGAGLILLGTIFAAVV